MSASILTPIALWRDFKIDGQVNAREVFQKPFGELITTGYYIDGKVIGQEKTQIFATITKRIDKKTMPAILVVRGLGEDCDENLIYDLASKGYAVMSVDITGRTGEEKEYYTEYPTQIDYANYEKAKDSLYEVKGSVGATCWYEWSCVVRYALKYLSGLKNITKIGGLGIADGATVLWQVVAMDENISCATFALNAGWIGYRGINKFGGQVEPQFSDSMYRFIAGVDSQSYAMHVKCPTLMLSATNSAIYDCDRAYDTVSRIDKSVYKAVHYSVGYRDRVSGEAYNDLCIFFDEYLKSTAKKKHGLPEEMDISAEFNDGKITVKISPDKNGIKNVWLYASEEITEPSKRCWFRHSDVAKKTEDGYEFIYHPYYSSGIVNFFAKVQYKNGFVIGSNVISKKITADEMFKGYKSNIIYSSRIEEGESVFSAANQIEENCDHVNTTIGEQILVKKGPMDIEGVYCKWGLLTFKINAAKDKPNADALLMFDVYVEKDCEFTVKLISDYYGNKKEYFVNVKVNGGDVWNNIRIEKTKFKTAEGMSLKSYSTVNAIEFKAEGEWLINNALWV